jgi:hypothetical protein
MSCINSFVRPKPLGLLLGNQLDKRLVRPVKGQLLDLLGTNERLYPIDVVTSPFRQLVDSTRERALARLTPRY